MTNVQHQNKALELLVKYRPTLWRKATLEAVPRSKHKALPVYMEEISLTQKLVESLKEDKRLGEKLYWIIHSTYMTDKQPCDIDEILADIAVKYGCIPRRTYFRLKKRAVEILDNRLEEMAAQYSEEKAAV